MGKIYSQHVVKLDIWFMCLLILYSSHIITLVGTLSVRIDFRRQNMTAIDVRFWRL